MKIIISPSKTQDFSNKKSMVYTETIFINKTNELVKNIQNLTKYDMKNIMKIKDDLLETTYKNYKNFHKNQFNYSILSYSGAVFKEIDVKNYNDTELNYLKNNVLILSALYGVLKPFDKIRPYRLDMTIKILEESLYKYWSKDINNFFKNEDIIINLASKEYSKLIKLPMINIDFKEKKESEYKSIGTYSKKARGMMINYIVKNQIKNIKDIKQFDLDRYSYNETLSDDKNIVFSR